MWVRDYLTKTVFDTFDVAINTFNTTTCNMSSWAKMPEHVVSCRAKWNLGLTVNTS